MKLKSLLFASFFVLTNAWAEAETAEALVQSMKKADMTYRQLMEVMGEASNMMHEGILRENKQMVEVGANFIFTHPAPKHKPWSIMAEEDQAGFKGSLLAFDKILDTHTNAVLAAARADQWVDANKALYELSNACIACHTTWRNKVK